MKKYIVTSTQFMGELVFGYHNDQLVYMDISQAADNSTLVKYIYDRLPIQINGLHYMVRQSKTFKVIEVPEDISFDNFWNKYAYKVGNKTKCQKLFNALPDEKKALAISKILAYRKYVENTGIAMVYPERYLSQERYENEF
jgi:hypothetical protein